VNSLSELGLEFTKKYVAYPGHSEHHTGLAIDLAHNQEQIDFICPDFPYEGICNEFRNKATDYGFVERYQSGKEIITGIAPEPWHFRYVGYPHSRLMHEQNLSLEEYIDYLKGFPSTGQHLIISHHEHSFEIFYVDLSASVRVRIMLPENSLYQISGNNVDGIIITLWRKDNEQ
jgi:D-alanyl-D-alanine dipeptidase/carboxypeptidase